MVRKCSLAYWPFHAITFEQKVFSKIHKLKTEKILYQSCMYLCLTDAFTNVVTDRQTGTQQKRKKIMKKQKEVLFGSFYYSIRRACTCT